MKTNSEFELQSNFGQDDFEIQDDSTWDGSETWESSVSKNAKNIFLEDFNNFEGDSERTTAHTQAMLAFTKRLLGKYVVMNRSISLIFILIHLSLFILALMKVIDNGVIDSESLVCRLANPMIYIWYMLMNGFLVWFYC